MYDLLENYLDKQWHIYKDNFYSTTKLLRDFQEHSTYECGTFRKDRGKFPANFQGKLQKGEMKFLHFKNLLVVGWFNERDVYALPSMHGTDKEELICLGDQKHIEKPKVIVEYNKYMNDVNKCGQYLSSIYFLPKNAEMVEKRFVQIFELRLIGSMIIYLHSEPQLVEKY